MFAHVDPLETDRRRGGAELMAAVSANLFFVAA